MAGGKVAKVADKVFRSVERELYDYPFNKKLVETWDKELAERIVAMALPVCDFHNVGEKKKGGLPSDTTGEAAIKLLMLSRKAELARVSCRMIEITMETLDERERKLVEEKYFKRRLTNYAIARMLHVSLREFYYMRAKVVEKFARVFEKLEAQ